ncbi:LOW QUALITY PROTEIN: hypothetical protein ACHAXN_002765 [Cyclotella atomus]
MITYDSGADGHYIIGVANGGTKHVTKLPFPQLCPPKANQADTFDDFPTSLMSVGKTADDGTISIFTKDGVTVHNEQDVLITCKGEPILGQWQPRQPRKQVTAKLQQANSVYDLPSIEQAIKWMHAVCGYPPSKPATSSAGLSSPKRIIIPSHYPESNKTQQGHMNQARKNVLSSRNSHTSAFRLRGKKEKDVFMKTYNVRETIFSDQTGKYPTTSQRGNKYIMVLVEIDSNAILVEHMKS